MDVSTYLALLTSSVVNCYCTYLCWDALTNDTSDTCNTWNNSQDTGIIITVGVLVLLITLFYVCFRKREKSEDQAPLRGVAEPILASEEPGDDAVPYKEEEGEGTEEDWRKMAVFHSFMVLTSIYFSMLLTNWGSAHIGTEDNYDK
jgi:Serine incorporator (Serinc)